MFLLEESGFCRLPVISWHFARNAKTKPSYAEYNAEYNDDCQVLCLWPSFMPIAKFYADLCGILLGICNKKTTTNDYDKHAYTTTITTN